MTPPKGMRAVHVTAEERELGLRFHFIRKGERIKRVRRCKVCNARIVFQKACPNGCSQHLKGGGFFHKKDYE